MLEKERYIDLHKQLHRSSLHFTGKSLQRWIAEINELMITHDCKDILDYGCGKALFWPKQWMKKIQGYDPAVVKFSEAPSPADMVICTDVMEHIPESLLDNTLKHINSLSNKWTFFVIDTKKAKKKFLNGENCHVTIKSPTWWQNKLNEFCTRHTVHFQI